MRRAALNPNNALIGDLLSVRPNWGVSTRRLTRRYAGACMNVRRSSDNATRDIFFAGDVLDVEAIRSFAGAGGSAFVVTWYDQFASTASALTQATTTAQPRILNAGALEVVGKKRAPAPRGFGAQTLRASTPPFADASEITVTHVQAEVSRGDSTAWSLNSGASRVDCSAPYATGVLLVFDVGGTSSPQRAVTTWPLAVGSNAVVTGLNSVSANTKSIRVNEAVLVTNTGTTGTNVEVQLFSGSGAFVDATIAEMLIFSSSLLPANLQKIETNQRLFYGI